MTEFVFPEINTYDGEMEEYVQEILLNSFQLEADTAAYLSSYISGIVEDAYNDPLESQESIQALLNGSIDNASSKKNICQFARQLVQYQVELREQEIKMENNSKNKKNNKKKYERKKDNNSTNNVNDFLPGSGLSNKYGNTLIVTNDKTLDASSSSRRNKRKNRRKTNQDNKMKEQLKNNNEKKKLSSLEKNEMLVANGDDLDDWGTQWKETRETNEIWGGRGRGGRGIQLRNINDDVEDVILEGVTLAYDGESLLERTKLQLVKGKIYGLIGRNGCGKSSLLKKIERGEVPGWPNSVSVEYVDQEVGMNSNKSAIELVVEASKKSLIKRYGSIEDLLFERKRIEEEISDETEEVTDNLHFMMERLCDIEDALIMLGATTDNGEGCADSNGNNNDYDSNLRVQIEAYTTAKQLLLQFNFLQEQLELPLKQLSGGFRMRVAIACAIICKPNILLFDEPTNHMDLHGVVWLERFINSFKTHQLSKNKKSSFLNYPNFKSIVIVSHDETFLDNVITDVILFYQKRLQYFAGTYTAYKKMYDETDLRKKRLLDKKADAEKKAKGLAEKQAQLVAKSKKGRKGHSFDPNKQRQAAERMRKAERAGFYREDGKRYHTMSLKTTTEHFLPQSISINDLRKDKYLKFKFPSINVQELRLASPESTLINLEKVSFKYPGKNNNRDENETYLLGNVTLQVNLKSRIAIVGPNGAGKTTLIKLICGELIGSNKIVMNPNVRIALVSQHHIEMLKNHLNLSATQYLKHKFQEIKEADARSHLGSFGLAGHLALQPVKLLSGGQKARLALAVVMWQKPHVLILDEPTNHLDMDSLRALATGLNDFQGAVLLVSHNQNFLSNVSYELWNVENGRVHVKVGVDRTATSFKELLNKYVESVIV